MKEEILNIVWVVKVNEIRPKGNPEFVPFTPDNRISPSLHGGTWAIDVFLKSKDVYAPGAP